MTVEALSDEARKKQLGQYFAHQRVGRLLAALAKADAAKSIIDPMVGSADLLLACLHVGARPERIFGIELDPIALTQAHSALDGLEGAELVLGDAFSTHLPETQFDLVITNPPYIRYQSKSEVEGIAVPTSAGVRAGLIHAIDARPGLSDEDRAVWLRAAREYPGTADIAVPAWILSAALVREGGVLAVVAPQAWLSRNYAQAVRTLFDTAFDVEVIVEDGDASWFDDAQVRTQLVVARRRPLTATGDGARRTVMARATRDLVSKGNLQGTMGSEQAVAAALHAVTSNNPFAVTTGLVARVQHSPLMSAPGQDARVPPQVTGELRAPGDGLRVRTLESYGWRAGQGLRSGANDFFYLQVVDGAVRPASRWGIESLAIPSACLLPAVRRQRELGDRFAVYDSQLPSRVVDLGGWVTASDSKTMSPGDAQILPTPVGKWIAQVASTPLSLKDPTKLFPDLAAVATNARTDSYGRPVRFWYQLPALAARHRPTLFVGRVCGGRPRAVLNGSDAVVDANFSGLWPVEPGALPPEALLALLNSNWTWANIEAACTVLGGGALKVEATDLRRLALPDLTAVQVSQLSALGRRLVDEATDAVLREIDQAVAVALVGERTGEEAASQLQALAGTALRNRSRN